MELLTNIIVEYLKHNKRLVVPRLGAFIVKQSNGVIVFSELMRNDDGVLHSLLTAYGMKELEATGMIDRLIFEIRHAVGRGNSFAIEGLGEFHPGENNTIIFKQERKVTSVGGNVRPPIEKLREEQIKMQRIKHQMQQNGKIAATPSTPRNSSATQRSTPPRSLRQNSGRQTNDSSSDIDMALLSKPDSHLRGLKYDSGRNKKREEGRGNSINRGMGNKRNLVIMSVVAVLVGIATWFAWSLFSDERPSTPIVAPEVIGNESVMPLIDSLDTADMADIADGEAATPAEDDTTNQKQTVE